MGEIRIVGPGKTRGYPYPVCKKLIVLPMGWDSSHETLIVTSVVYKYYLHAIPKTSK